MELAAGAPLSLDWTEDQADEAPAPPVDAAPIYSTPDDAESPFAAALRKATTADTQKRRS